MNKTSVLVHLDLGTVLMLSLSTKYGKMFLLCGADAEKFEKHFSDLCYETHATSIVVCGSDSLPACT